MGPKKKLTRAERNRLEMEKLERARIQAELEAQRALEEERRRLALEKKLAKEKEKKETAEQALRMEQLTNSNSFIKNMLDYSWNLDREERDEIRWKQYLKCDGLPTPTDPAQMNTYLHLWRKVSQDVTVEEARRRTKEIIALLQVLEDFIDDPFDAPPTLIENWKWIRTLCRDQQQENLDMATYRLLRDINKRMNRIDIPTADFNIIDENFILCLWLAIKLATPMHNPRAPAKKRLEINFPETRLNILFPSELDYKGIVIRAMYLTYDHFSDNCDTYHKPEVTGEFDRDLLECTSQEWYTKMKYKWDNRRRRSKSKKIEQNSSLDEEILDDEAYAYKEGDVPPPVPYRKLEPSASQYAMNQEGMEDLPKHSILSKTKMNSSKTKNETIEGDAQNVPKTSTIRIVEDNAAPVVTEQGEGQAEAPNGEPKELTGKGKKGKHKKSYAALLTDDPVKFKNISFENALTAEEKAAKKAEKKAEKKAGKKGGKKGEAKAETGETIDDETKIKSIKSTSKEGLVFEAASKEKIPKEIQSRDKLLSRDKFASKDMLASKEKVVSKDKLESKEKVALKENVENELEKPPPAKQETPDEKKGKKKGGEKKGKKKGGSSAASESDVGKAEVTDEKPVTEKSETESVVKDKDKKKKKKEKRKSEDESEEEKKGKKEKSSEGEIEPSKKVKKKKTSKTHIKQKSSVNTLLSVDTASIQSDTGSVTRKPPAKKVGKSVSWIGATRKKKLSKTASVQLASNSSMIMQDSYLDSEMSMQSFGSNEESRMGVQESFTLIKLKPSGSKTKHQKVTIKQKPKVSKSVSLAPEDSGEPTDEGAKPKKGKKKEAKGDAEKTTGSDASEKKEETTAKEKKKKKKKSESEASEPPAAETDDVMLQIQKMKAAAAAQVAGPAQPPPSEVSEKPKKKEKKEKKKKKKKDEMPEERGRKLSDAERLRMEAEKAEQARIQAELDAKKAEDEERRRIEEERRQGREKEKRESAEQQLRVEQLAHTLHLIKNMQEASWNTNYKEKIDLEWEQYLKCDGLPNPIKPAEMNTYLHLWEQVLHNVSVDQVRHRTSEIIALLEVLQDYIDDPFDASDTLIADWKWVRALCREHQQENIDMATYHLLRDIDSRLHRIDIPTADFHINEDNFNLSLWLYVQLATPMYNPRAQIKKRLDIQFEEMGLTVLFPHEIDVKCMAIRATYLKYDHLSDTCVLYNRPPIPADIDKDIDEAAANEWARKMWYKWKHRPPPVKKMVEDAEGNMIEVEEPEPEILPGELPPTVPWQKLEPTASVNELDTENELYEKIHRKLCIEVSDKIINLRKYLIIGGIYCIDLFYQPPQPHDQVAFDIRITSLQIPKRLYEVPFYIGYSAPTADSDAKKPPEELEEQMKQQELELDKLMLVTLTLPEHVMFLDLPTVCHWNKKRRIWTTEDVHDLKHIEEKNYMTFRTGRFGQFALAVNRYINFPFQAWELKPEADGTVTFQITCAILMVEFNIKENRVCLTQLQNSPNNALQDIVGTYFKLPKLIRILQTGGVDLFPACDAFCYIEGTCEKHWPTERHLYYNMALLSPSFNFAWSRWNNQAGRRNIVIQMREYKLNSTKQKNHSMLLVTPLKALFVETTEVSSVFNEIPAEGMKFYSDLFNVMKGTSTMATRNRVQNGSPDVAKTLADLLIMTRVVSFS